MWSAVLNLHPITSKLHHLHLCSLSTKRIDRWKQFSKFLSHAWYLAQSTYLCRVQSMSGVFQKIDSHPLSTQRVCPPPAPMAGGTHSPGGEGVGGQYLEYARHWIGLLQYNPSTVSSVEMMGRTGQISHLDKQVFASPLHRQMALPVINTGLHFLFTLSLKPNPKKNMMYGTLCRRWL